MNRRHMLELVALCIVWGAHARAEVPVIDWGVLTQTTRFEGGFVSPTLVTMVHGDAVSVAGLPAGTLDATLRLPLGARAITFEATMTAEFVTRLEARGTLPIVVPGVDPAARPTLDWHAPGALSVRARGFDMAVLGRALPALPLEGRGELELTLTGRAEAPQGRVVLSTLPDDPESLRWRGAPLGETRIELTQTDTRSTLSGHLGPAAAPHLRFSAEVPVTMDLQTGAVRWHESEPHQVSITGRGLTPKNLRPFWRAPVAADFTVDLDAQSAGHLDRFFADVVVRGTLRDGDRPPLRVMATGRLEPARQALTLRLGRDALFGAVEARARLPEIVRGTALPAEAPLSGFVNAAVPLETIAPYLPSILSAPRGRLDAALTLEGTLGTPALHGSLDLEKAATTIESLLLRLTALDAHVAFNGQTATLTRLHAQSGAGELTGEGSASWSTTPRGSGTPASMATPEPPRGSGTPSSTPPTPGSLAPASPYAIWSDWRVDAEGHLAAREVPFVQPEIPFGLLTGRLTTHWTARPSSLETRFEVHDTRLETSRESMPPARAIPRNASVRNRDWLARVRPAESVLAGEGHLGLTVTLATPIVIEGEDTALRLTGAMIMNRDDTRVTVEGGFDVLDGHFILFENPFTLRQGRLTLQAGDLNVREAVDARAAGTGDANLLDTERAPEALPLEPVLSLIANGYVVDTDVTVGLRGPARQPQLVLRSNPPLAEYQILTLLITGRANALDDSNGDVRREAARLVDRFHNPSLERQLYDRLGVDKLGLAFGDAVDQPILTVGRQLTRTLYLETVYHHNAPPTDNGRELRVEYQLSPRWSLDTAYGDAAVGNVDLAWKGRFGGQPPARPRSSLLADEAIAPPLPPGAAPPEPAPVTTSPSPPPPVQP